jgi:hypothetical protein
MSEDSRGRRHPGGHAIAQFDALSVYIGELLKETGLLIDTIRIFSEFQPRISN